MYNLVTIVMLTEYQIKKYFEELNIQGFDFTNGFEISDYQKFEKTNNSSKSIFEVNFYQIQNIWRHEIIPLEVSDNDSDRVVDLLIYKKNFVLIEKLHIILGGHNCMQTMLEFRTIQKLSIKQKQQ